MTIHRGYDYRQALPWMNVRGDIIARSAKDENTDLTQAREAAFVYDATRQR